MNSSRIFNFYLRQHQIRRYNIIVLSLILLGTIIITLGIGIVHIPVKTTVSVVTNKIPFLHNIFSGSWSATHEAIILHVRLPRVILGALIGSSLATSGAIMQGLFRNPMASPYVLGISSGAAFGAALSIVLNLQFLGRFTLSLMAFIFAILTMILVYTLSSRHGKTFTQTVLLIGIAVSLFFSSLVSFMIYISGEEVRAIVFWIMGGLWAGTWGDLAMILPIIIFGVAALSFFSRDINTLLSGEDQALSLGTNVQQVIRIMLILTSLITAASVSISGVIGFVGLIVPHIMRNLVGVDYRILIPSSCLGGAIFLIVADTIARTVADPVEIPVGILTGLIGAPFFIYLLSMKSKRPIGMS